MRHICPICKKLIRKSHKKEQKPVYFPFCSARCKLIDLGCWLDDKYRIADRTIQSGLAPKTEKTLENPPVKDGLGQQ